MSSIIPLLPMTAKPDAKAHMYPIQIALQTQQILQAAVFHAILTDLAAGQRVRQPGAIDEIESELIANGLNQRTLDGGWQYLKDYKDLFSEYLLQAAPITMKSHWDWYIRKLARFIQFARYHCGSPPLSTTTEKQLRSLGKRESPIAHQVEILRSATGLEIPVEPANTTALMEMSLVRNIGIHNRWEVDEVYLANTTKSGRWILGEIRSVDQAEALQWRSALDNLLINTWSPIAQLYVKAPAYPPGTSNW
jgi:hypothetical protein